MPEKPTCEELAIISIPFDTQLPICYTSQVKSLKFKVPKVPKVKGTKMAFFICFGPVFIGLKMGFPILSR